MPYLLNLLYLALGVLLSPWLLYKLCITAKWRRNLWTKLTGATPWRHGNRPCVWFHGVSMGEIHLLRQVVARFRQARPDCEVVVSASTVTGLAEARKHFSDLTVCCWPFDFSWAIKRALRRVRPALVVLAESEVWPNFLLVAKRLGVRVAVINGRMSPRSVARYRKVAPLARGLVRRVDLWAMSTVDYAAGMRDLGVPAESVVVTGNVKYDGVKTDRDNPATRIFRNLFGIQADDLVWVAGSTQTPEEDIVLDIYQKVRTRCPQLRLILVPRQPDRFDAVAELLRARDIAFVRRSQLASPVTDREAVILGDSTGELAAVWGLADLAFVGGSLDGQRGGQNMIEPAAYGAAVVFGPHTWNFKETVTRLLALDAAIAVPDARALGQQILTLALDVPRRQRLGLAAQQFVRSQQGATGRTVALLQDLLGRATDNSAAA
jgi:3-deoxy-D-manno-octulosonic-acid transferase